MEFLQGGFLALAAVGLGVLPGGDLAGLALCGLAGLIDG